MNPPRKLRIRIADGRYSHYLPSKDASPLTLADALADLGHPLNTRCGGRGLCRGCRVNINGETVRACQISLQEVDPEIHEIVIPESSLHDEKLDGVSAFEIGFTDPPYNRHPGVGLALDIGTTTVGAALWDLESGRCLAEGTIANAQRRFGDNVLARIEFSRNQTSSKPLQTILIDRSIRPLLETLLQRAGLEGSDITEAVASGNTVMLHTLIGETLEGFVAYPFSPVFLDGRILRSKTIGFENDFPLHLVSGLGAFVGGDISAGALASGMVNSTDPALLIDFGTNGEILLKTGHGYMAAATAAGPAFEGGRLNCGRPAAPGVIGALSFDDGQWCATRIGNKQAVPGISGSAYVDFIAQAASIGLLNTMGRFEKDHPMVLLREIDGEETPVVEIDGEVFITEADIAELMQAKAAILGGVHTLLEEAQLEVAELATVYVAGGFGYHLNPRHAITIGLLPNVSPDRIRVIGNSSLAGASLLLQTDLTETLENLRSNCLTLELNQIDSFEDHFIDAMSLAG